MKTRIYFKYGAMNSGKTLELLKIAYNYEENGITPLILKSVIDTRSSDKVYSRIGLEKKAIEISEKSDVEEVLKDIPKVILIDESQFLNPELIDAIIDFSYKNNIETIMFFGLKNNIHGELFPGAKRIIERSDKIEESTSICWCGTKARQNARVVNNKIDKKGPTIIIENKENKVEYVTLCNYHFFSEELKDEKNN